MQDKDLGSIIFMPTSNWFYDFNNLQKKQIFFLATHQGSGIILGYFTLFGWHK